MINRKYKIPGANTALDIQSENKKSGKGEGVYSHYSYSALLEAVPLQ